MASITAFRTACLCPPPTRRSPVGAADYAHKPVATCSTENGACRFRLDGDSLGRCVLLRLDLGVANAPGFACRSRAHAHAVFRRLLGLRGGMGIT